MAKGKPGILTRISKFFDRNRMSRAHYRKERAEAALTKAQAKKIEADAAKARAEGSKVASEGIAIRENAKSKRIKARGWKRVTLAGIAAANDAKRQEEQTKRTLATIEAQQLNKWNSLINNNSDSAENTSPSNKGSNGITVIGEEGG